MKVSELIEKLKALPKDYDIYRVIHPDFNDMEYPISFESDFLIFDKEFRGDPKSEPRLNGGSEKRQHVFRPGIYLNCGVDMWGPYVDGRYVDRVENYIKTLWNREHKR